MGKRRRRRRIRSRRVATTLWGGTFCRHLEPSANFVATDASVEVYYCVDI
jgi:transcription elongation factor Elf1